MLVAPRGPILDVGCGAGNVCASHAAAGIEVVGVEPDGGAADQAETRYASVHRGTLNDFSPSTSFEQVVLADVLEHMEDPWSALVQVREELLVPDGSVIASIPNVRHWTVVVDLLLRGRWEYTDAGLLDRTHLRFFTRTSVVDMFSRTGYELSVLRPHYERRLTRLLARLLPGNLGELMVIQWLVVARPASGASANAGLG